MINTGGSMNCKICGKDESLSELWAIPEVGIICEECLNKINKINEELKRIKEEVKDK
jgi:hypothetical protein